MAEYAAYADLLQKLLASQSNDKIAQFSSPEAIAEIVYQAATGQQEQLRYPAGPDAVAAYTQRLAAGPETFRQGVAAQFGLPSEPGHSAAN